MKKRLTELFGINKASNTENKKSVKSSKYTRKGPNEYYLVKKPPLNDLFIRKIAAAMIAYPQLIEQYEERLCSFEWGKNAMADLLKEVISSSQRDGYEDSENLIGKLKLNHPKEIESLWELKMYQMQKPTIPDLKKEINTGLTEIQLKQLDKEINECFTLMKNNTNSTDEIYKKYQRLISERNDILANQED